MRYRCAVPFFLVAFLFQSTLMNHLKIFGIAPNLILCLVILFSFLYEGNHGAILGVVFGLFQDLCFAPLIGPSAIAYFLAAIAIKQLRRIFYRDNLLSVFFASTIGTAIYILLLWTLNAIFGGTYQFVYILKMIPVAMAYHFMIMIIFYLLRGRIGNLHPRGPYYVG